MFFRNNWNDPNIVPTLNPNRFNLLKKNTLGEKDRFQNYSYIAVRRKERVDLYRKASIEAGDKSVYIQITKLGNGKFLKEYVDGSLDLTSQDGYKSILPKNNISNVGTDVTINRDSSDVNLKENVKGKYDTKNEMETLRQRDKDSCP